MIVILWNNLLEYAQALILADERNSNAEDHLEQVRALELQIDFLSQRFTDAGSRVDAAIKRNC